jgi:uncharacterized protein
VKNSRTILRTISQDIDNISKFGVKNIGLFGSLARDCGGPKSDIDIIVEFHKEQKTYSNYAGLKDYLEVLFGSKVDLVIKEAIKKRIRKNILKDARYA